MEKNKSSKQSRFTKRIENGRLRLIPANKAVDTVKEATPAFKRIAKKIIDSKFAGILN